MFSQCGVRLVDRILGRKIGVHPGGRPEGPTTISRIPTCPPLRHTSRHTPGQGGSPTRRPHLRRLRSSRGTSTIRRLFASVPPKEIGSVDRALPSACCRGAVPWRRCSNAVPAPPPACHKHYNKWFMLKGLLSRALIICNNQSDFMKVVIYYKQGLISRGFPISTLRRAWRKFKSYKIPAQATRKTTETLSPAPTCSVLCDPSPPGLCRRAPSSACSSSNIVRNAFTISSRQAFPHRGCAAGCESVFFFYLPVFQCAITPKRLLFQ